MKTLMLPVSVLSVGLDFRLDDDPDEMAELAQSVAECGVLQPLLVRPLGEYFWEVIAGRRRLAAARTAGLEEVPCVERSLTDDQAAEVALAENLHRRQLSPIEEALAYARLRDRGMHGQEIAGRVGKSGGHVSSTLALLTIPDALQAAVHRRELSPRTALERAGRRKLRTGGGDQHPRPHRRRHRRPGEPLAAAPRPAPRRHRDRAEGPGRRVRGEADAPPAPVVGSAATRRTQAGRVMHAPARTGSR